MSDAIIGGAGVRGDYGGVPFGYGVYSTGRFGASGTKEFRIDRPADPENKYLLHYFSEGPEPRNVYQGMVITGTNGYAWVTLPDYYPDINKDPLYQLTVVDSGEDFIQTKVTDGVRGNRFRIRSSKPNIKVCWRVDAVRNDRWVRKYGAPVEQIKEGLEKGTYQHPELYGLGPDRGMNNKPDQENLRLPPQTELPGINWDR